MNFDLPSELISYLNNLDSFIESTILPLQHTNDNNRFFDHRREYTRTDWARGGLPMKEWEDLLGMSSTSRQGLKLIAIARQSSNPGRQGRILPIRSPPGLRRPGTR